MRVAFIVEKFPNVSETFILDEIVGLLERGVDIAVYAFRRGSEADVHPTYMSHRLNERTTYCSPKTENAARRVFEMLLPTALMAVRNPRALLKTILTRKKGVRTRTFISLARAFVNNSQTYDVIHAHFGPNGIRAAVLRSANVFRTPLITTFHGYDVTSFVAEHGTSGYADLARDGESFVAVSRSIGLELEKIGFPANRTTVLPLGVDAQGFTTKSGRGNDGAIRVLSIGRFVEKKGLEYGIRAVVRAAQFDPNLRYDIIGDGDLRPQLEQLIREIDSSRIVTLHGYKDQANVRAMLARSDIMLVPSVTAVSGDQEGLPVVVKEAMASGLAIVASLHAGIPEIVEDGVTGLLAPERDVDKLAMHLSTLARNEEKRLDMGRAARAVIERSFETSVHLDQLQALYQNVIGSSREYKAATLLP